MALTRCPDCGNTVSESAPACPHCGRPRTAPSGSSAVSKSIAIGCAAIFLLLLTCFLITPNESSHSNPYGDSGMAAIMCQDFVKRRLRAPATAQFPNIYSADTRRQDLGQGRYRIEAYVDAQNGFGALIRNTFTCVINKTPNTDTWNLESLQIQ